MAGENQTLEQQLTQWARGAFAGAFPDAELPEAAMAVQETGDPAHGEYQCNAAMGLAKVLKRPPRAIAEVALQAVPLPPAVARAEIAGPGFINFHLDRGWLAVSLERESADGTHLGVPGVGAGKTVVIDYSSPNVAKQMHIGHIRSTVIGHALDRLHRFLGYRVIADNHLGDWGTQFGILIHGYRHLADPAALAADPVAELERIYVASYGRAEADAAWMDAARAELVKLQRGDPENRALWQQFLDWSMGEFDAIYRRLGVSFDVHRGESHYEDRLPALLDRLAAQGIAVPSEGAQVVFLEDEGLPVCIVRKSDGAANYATTDLATIESRVEEFAPEAIIYVTDQRQQTHFRQVFAIARRLGVRTRLIHVWFGLMRLPEGTFSTREGNVIKLHRLLDEAELRALQIVRESSPDIRGSLRASGCASGGASCAGPWPRSGGCARG
jgi:arginyl-tRNA synthetase